MPLTKRREKMTRLTNLLTKKRARTQMIKLWKFKLIKMFKLMIKVNKPQNKKIKIWLKNKV
jgi:hypothetical protein